MEIGSVVPVTMTFRNGSTVAHNLTFTDGLSAATPTIVEPGAVEELHLDQPADGEYPFVCTIHAEMTADSWWPSPVAEAVPVVAVRWA